MFLHSWIAKFEGETEHNGGEAVLCSPGHSFSKGG